MVIKRLILTATVLSTSCFAASGSMYPLLDANVDISKTTSLQRGATAFFNYCSGCHSLQYMRYNRIAEDLGLEESLVKTNFMHVGDKIGNTVQVAMKSEDAKSWFGVKPPDLSVISRVRGEDWLYSFLNGFYTEPGRPTGVNNLYFAQTSMPHVLWELQGYKKLILQENEKTTQSDKQNGGSSEYPYLATAVPGKMTHSEYREFTRDIVSFLVYVGEPARLVRYKLGFWVIAFLFVLFIFAYLNKKAIWEDIK